MSEKTLHSRARSYANRFFPERWYASYSSYIAGFNRGQLVERKDAWDRAAIFYDAHPEKATQRAREIIRARQSS